MITLATGSVFDSDAEAVVNTVNCVGVMGKGVALEAKRLFPGNFVAYVRACELGEVRPGRMFTVETGRLSNPRYVINFPTKRHWRSSARLEDIRSGLRALVGEVQRLGLDSLAIPALGCGNGGLDWTDVRPLIEEALAPLDGLRVELYAPRTRSPRTPQ